jgi:hypothetical protein
MESPLNGQPTLTPDQARQFEAGEWYINIHTQAHPDGEIRGQVLTPLPSHADDAHPTRRSRRRNTDGGAAAVLSYRSLSGGMAMRRRAFIAAIGGAAAWPFVAPAQQSKELYRIGYLSLGSPASEATRFDAFRARLATLGYVEDKNLVIETRWLEGGKYDQVAVLAAQLVGLKVDVIVTYATSGVLAAKRATTTIPIVFASVGDAVWLRVSYPVSPGRAAT